MLIIVFKLYLYMTNTKLTNGIMKSLEMSIATKTELAMKMVILDAIEKGHTNKNDLINYMAIKPFESAVKSYISFM